MFPTIVRRQNRGTVGFKSTPLKGGPNTQFSGTQIMPHQGGKLPADVFVRGHNAGVSRLAAGQPTLKSPRMLRFGNKKTNRQVDELLKRIPDEYVQELSRFFRVMMTSKKKPIGYTMFGEIPVSVIDWHEVAEQNLMSGYELWTDYTRDLPSDNTLLRPQRINSYDPLPSICMINKAAFLETVGKHLDQFKQVLGHDITPKKLLDDFMSDELPIWSLNAWGNKLHGSRPLFALLSGLNEQDTVAHPDHEVRVSSFDFDPLNPDAGPVGNQDYSRVCLPRGLLINRLSAQSFLQVKHWKDQQPSLQALVNIPDDRKFLTVVMRKWADASSVPSLT